MYTSQDALQQRLNRNGSCLMNKKNLPLYVTLLAETIIFNSCINRPETGLFADNLHRNRQI